MDTISEKIMLTHREVEILRLISSECSSSEISDRLGISIRTVETHRKNLTRKTGSRSVIGLFKFAIKEGLLKEYICLTQS